MVDTVRLRLVTNDGKRAINSLHSGTEIVNRDTGELICTTGKLNNLDVTIYSDSVLVKNSLEKFHFSNNVEPFRRHHVKDAMQYICDALGLPMDDAIVGRVDIGVATVISKPLAAYLQAFGNVPRYERHPYRTGLQWRNTLRTLSLYDPVELMKCNRERIPDLCIGKNMVRVEEQHKKDVSSQYKRTVFGRDLYSDDFFSQSAASLRKLVSSIRPERRFKHLQVFGQVRSIPELNTLCVLDVIKKVGGLRAALDALKVSYKTGKIDRGNYNHLKRKIEQVSAIEPYTLDNGLIVDFQSAIFAEIDSYLSK